jgi:putative tryptophan/tyrosine transport system substrate-binding protein
MSTRRQLLLAAGAALIALPRDLCAQQKVQVWRVGILASVRRPESLESDEQYGAFARGLRDLGYVEGKNLMIEWRFVDGQYERFPAMAAELVKIPVDVIVTDGTPPTVAAQRATSTIPIVFGSAGDPVGNGLVKNLARPGGNTTGISLVTTDTAPKQLEMLISMAPQLSRVAVLLNPVNPYSAVVLKGFQAAAKSVGVTILPVEARSKEEIASAFVRMIKERAGAFIITGDRFFFSERRQIADLAVHYRLPNIARERNLPAAGGLMSYGQNLALSYYRAGAYVDKILRGANPGDLPVEQPTRLDLVINRKAAKALGLEIPPELLVLADKVIE